MSITQQSDLWMYHSNEIFVLCFLNSLCCYIADLTKKSFLGNKIIVSSYLNFSPLTIYSMFFCCCSSSGSCYSWGVRFSPKCIQCSVSERQRLALICSVPAFWASLQSAFVPWLLACHATETELRSLGWVGLRVPILACRTRKLSVFCRGPYWLG